MLIALVLLSFNGSPDHPESMIVLRPGEWIRVKANVLLRKWPEESISIRFRGDFWLRKNTFRPHPGGPVNGRTESVPEHHADSMCASAHNSSVGFRKAKTIEMCVCHKISVWQPMRVPD